MQDRAFLLTTAALLHDVGKAFNKLNYSKALEEAKQRFGNYYHHYTGAALVIEAMKAVKKDEGKYKLLAKIASLIASHHEKQGDNWSEDNRYYKRPIFSVFEEGEFERYRDALIKADHLSAAEGRQSKEQLEGTEKVRLLKPFYVIEDIDQEANLGEYLLYPARYLTFTEKQSEGGLVKEFYDELIEHLRKIPLGPKKRRGWILSLLRILREYTLYINSYQQSKVPHTSLYAHSLTTAAIARALLGGKVYVVTIDIKGIQKYLTNLGFKNYTGKATGKILRGRSFLVDKLTKVFAWELFKKWDLSSASAILLTSGKATILTPTVEGLDEIVRAFNLALLKDGYWPLKVHVGVYQLQKLSKEELREGIRNKAPSNSLSLTSRIMASALNEKVIASQGEGVCEVCGHVGKNIREVSLNEGSLYLCPACREALETGAQLGKEIEKGGYGIFELKHRLAGKEYGATEELVIWTKLRKEDSPDPIWDSSDGWMYDLVPHGNLNLDKMAQEGDRRKKLMFVMLDFDNMGRLFKKIGKTSISRIVELSLFMERFGIELMDKIGGAEKEKREKIYVIYAGGDDITFLGDPKTVIEGMEELVNELNKIQKPKRKLSLSGGIIAMDAKYPLVLAYDEVQKAEKKAKQHKDKGELGRIWLGYLPQLKEETSLIVLDKYSEFKKKLDEYDKYLSSKEIPVTSSFIYNLYALHDPKAAGFHLSKRVPKEYLGLLNEGYALYMWNKIKPKENDGWWKKLQEDYKDGVFFRHAFTVLILKRWYNEI